MLNQAPYRWTIRHLLDTARKGPHARMPDGQWEPARPFGFFSFPSRLSLAWAVFTGRADALFWPDQNPKAY